MYIKLLLAVAIFLASLWSSEGLECKPDTCFLIDCKPITEAECNGVFVRNGGPCGCCDACYDAIEPGQPCRRLDVNNPPKGLCKNGYRCDRGICKPLLTEISQLCIKSGLRQGMATSET